MIVPIKLERLSLTSLPNLVLCLRVRSEPSEEPFNWSTLG